ncbi:hypothetical protein [Paenibacillus hemerocallicola]|nr:hypothetical protein [Paenibacillus hemerocallicola]
MDQNILKVLSARKLKAAQIGLGVRPTLLDYPFPQKYFIKGIVLGSAKG